MFRCDDVFMKNVRTCIYVCLYLYIFPFLCQRIGSQCKERLEFITTQIAIFKLTVLGGDVGINQFNTVYIGPGRTAED